ncbi:phosphopantothenate--cysteine ligase [Streptococcus hyovaginalis]
MKILITSGGTTEAIDSVRGITNHSTGKLGKRIAETFVANGHHVTLVTTKQALKPKASDLLTIEVVDNVASLEQILKILVPKHDVMIHAMAVSDYTPVYMADLEEVKQTDIDTLLHAKNQETKISSRSEYQVLFLKKTPKMISLVKQWHPSIKLIGFKLLVAVSQEELLAVARESLIKNQADLIVANDLSQISGESHPAFLVKADSITEAATKEDIAQLLYNEVITND